MLWRLHKQVDIYAPEVAECEGHIYFLKNLAFLVSRSQMTAPSYMFRSSTIELVSVAVVQDFCRLATFLQIKY